MRIAWWGLFAVLAVSCSKASDTAYPGTNAPLGGGTSTGEGGASSPSSGGAGNEGGSSSGHDGGGTSSSSGGGSSLGYDCAAQAKAFCSRIKKCDGFIFDLAYGSAQVCERRSEEACATLASLDGIAPSYMAYEGACAEAFANASCTKDVAEVCDDPPKGNVDLGGSCLANAECAEGVCFTLDDVSCGICVIPAKEGESCSESPCERGLFCVDATCIVPIQEGHSCTSTAECEGQLFCIDQKCGSLHEGDSCDPDNDQCPDYLWCATDKCEVFPMANVGDACGTNDSGDFHYCKGNGYCSTPLDEDGVCKERGTLGDPCSSKDPASTKASAHTCEYGLYCPATTCELQPSNSCD